MSNQSFIVNALRAGISSPISAGLNLLKGSAERQISSFADQAGSRIGTAFGRRIGGKLGSEIQSLIGSAAGELGSKLSKKLFGNVRGLTYSNPNSVLTRMQNRQDPLWSIDWNAKIFDGGRSPIEDIYIESIQTPSIRIENKPIYREGSTLNYAGGISVDNATIVLYNDISGKAMKLGTSWVDCVYNYSSSNFRMPSEYKKNIKIFFYDVKQNTVATVDLIGCFPTSFNSFALNNSDANPIPVTIELSVDSMYFS